MENKPPRISFIIVNFQSHTLLERCLSSIGRLSETNAEIIVVNNDPAPLELLPKNKFSLFIIQASHNLGFGAGINLGARSARGEYLFFLNPDAEIITDSISSALDEFTKNPRLAILGGKIVDDQGKPQDWTFGEAITPLRIIKNNLGMDQNKRLRKQKGSLLTDWISGGAMMIRKDIFQKLSGFDEKIFMYYEDIDLCRRAKQLGFEILHFPGLVVRHLGGKSFNNKEEQKKHYYQSQDYYFQKHFGKFYAFLIKWLKIVFLPISYIRKNS